MPEQAGGWFELMFGMGLFVVVVTVDFAVLIEVSFEDCYYMPKVPPSRDIPATEPVSLYRC